jgi:D-serine deaminase-like pyridoxal phosphate-dependent protein
MMDWYKINTIESIDSPALLLYKERIQQNITAAIKMVKQVSLLRPHVKTNKIAEVCALMMAAGISKFKCATIAEAEMLAMIGAKDVLLAYQPVGPKAKRILSLVLQYPGTRFSCLVDNADAVSNLAEIFAGRTIDVFIDLNTGMNRSGIKPTEAIHLFKQIQKSGEIVNRGLHVYDGHITDTDLLLRREKSNKAFEEVSMLADQIEQMTGRSITIIAGGSPTFPIHASRNVECSPGTFVFWDWSYKHQFPGEPFDYAAVVITRVVSIVDDTTITVDLGHKSVAAENPLPRVYFLNAPGVIPVSQSEEHLVLETKDSSVYKTGDVLYGIPLHICPTVALYDKALVVENDEVTAIWEVVARVRKITL